MNGISHPETKLKKPIGSLSYASKHSLLPQGVPPIPLLDLNWSQEEHNLGWKAHIKQVSTKKSDNVSIIITLSSFNKYLF